MRGTGCFHTAAGLPGSEAGPERNTNKKWGLEMDKVNTKATGEKSGQRAKSAIGPLTMRDAVVVLGGILVIVGSLFPIPWSKTVSVNMWIFPGLPFHLLIALVLPLLVAGGFAWRRFTGRTRVRIGSLSLDQAGSVVALVAAAYFFNSYVASMSPAYLIGFVGALAMVIGTTLASYFGAFRRDFATGGETVLGSDLAPAAREDQPAAGKSGKSENKDSEIPASRVANIPRTSNAASRTGKTVAGKEETPGAAPAKEAAPSTAGVKPGAAATPTAKTVSDSAAGTGAAAAGAGNTGVPKTDASPKSVSTPAGQASEAIPKRKTPGEETQVPEVPGSRAATPAPVGPGAGTPGSDAKTPSPGARSAADSGVQDAKADPLKPEAPANPSTPGASSPRTEDKPTQSAPAPKTPRDVRESRTGTGAAKPETNAGRPTVPAASTGSGTPVVPGSAASSFEASKDKGDVLAKENVAGSHGGAAAKPASADGSASDTPTPEQGKERDAATSDGRRDKSESAIATGTGAAAGAEAGTSRQDGPTPPPADQAKVSGSATDKDEPATSAHPAAKPSVPVSGGAQATAALSRADFDAHRAAAEKAKAEAEAESSFGARAESEDPEPVPTSFWFALNHPRPVFHHLNGTMLETLYPGTWILCVEDRGSDYFINLPDGRPAVLRNLDDLQFPQQ